MLQSVFTGYKRESHIFLMVFSYNVFLFYFIAIKSKSHCTSDVHTQPTMKYSATFFTALQHSIQEYYDIHFSHQFWYRGHSFSLFCTFWFGSCVTALQLCTWHASMQADTYAIVLSQHHDISTDTHWQTRPEIWSLMHCMVMRSDVKCAFYSRGLFISRPNFKS